MPVRKSAVGGIERLIFAAWVGRILPAGAVAGVPFMDRGVELHPGIAADVCALGNFSEQRPRLFPFAWLTVDHAARPPFATFERSFHELIGHAHAQVFVLIHDRAVSVAVVTAVVTLL